jgi:drug/metabolite transporter (DMT)-like permease
MNWLTVTIISYFLFAAVVLADKYILSSSVPNPKVYVFYVGALGTLALLLIPFPFTHFQIPGILPVVLGILAGTTFICSIFWFYKGLSLFEASRMAPAVGGLTPFFTLGLIFLFSGGKERISFVDMAAFLVLVAGSTLMVSEKSKFINLKSLRISAASAFFGSLSFVLSKYLYSAVPSSFWTAYILKAMGATLGAVIVFAIFKEVRQEVLKTKPQGGLGKKFSLKPTALFLGNQSVGATANILQNWAIALAPLPFVAFINALQGTQYVFILVFSIIISLKFPKIIKEAVSKGIVLQKICAILLIGAGLALLALKN